MLEECSVDPGALVSGVQLIEQLDALLARHSVQGCATRMVLGDHWARHWMVTPPKNATRLRDCRVAAQARFQYLFGEPMDDWQLAADWQAREAFLAFALPRPFVQATHSLASRHKLLLLEIIPQSVASWNRWRHAIKPGCWFGVVHDGLLTLGARQGKRLVDLRSLSLTPHALAQPDWLRLAVEREAVRGMFDLPKGIQLCGEVPQAWLAFTAENWFAQQLDQAAQADAASLSTSAGYRPQALVAAAGWR